MTIFIVRHIPAQKLEELVRQVPLKGKDEKGQTILPYAKSRIVIREMHPDELNPGSKYLIQKQIDFQRELRKMLMDDHGIDMFRLEGGYVLENSGDGRQYTLIPPIIEVTEEIMRWQDTRGDVSYEPPTTVRMNVVVDGLHRLQLARWTENTSNVLHISGIPREYPFYALPNRWDEVLILQQAPEETGKKNYRMSSGPKRYGLYRDFGILGCGDPRKPGSTDTRAK